MRQLFLLFIAASLISCSALISSATKPMLDCMVAPMQNRELQTLQSNLLTYWLIHGKTWPDNILILRDFSDSSGSPLSLKFKNLVVGNLEDSVFANYQLVYEESDSTEYKDVLGQLSIKVTSDTTINLRYKVEKVEMKNGTICTSQDPQYLTKSY
jgi:hypothetical protein